MSCYSFGKATPLDAEVAVRCFDFRWFASKKNKTEDGRPLCSIHVGPSWLDEGWIRWNWAEAFYDELPIGTIWPDPEKYEVYNGWERLVGKEHDSPRWGSQYMNLPTFSQDWLAGGMLIEWLQSKLEVFTFTPEWVFYQTRAGQTGFHPTDGTSVLETICHVAIEVAKREKS